MSELCCCLCSAVVQPHLASCLKIRLTVVMPVLATLRWLADSTVNHLSLPGVKDSLCVAYETHTVSLLKQKEDQVFHVAFCQGLGKGSGLDPMCRGRIPIHHGLQWTPAIFCGCSAALCTSTSDSHQASCKPYGLCNAISKSQPACSAIQAGH